MKLTVKQAELKKKMSAIQSIMATGGSMPILTHFKLTAAKDGSLIEATDNTLYLREPIEVQIEEEGSCCIPRKFLEVAREVEGDIRLQVKDSSLHVTSGKSKFKVPVMDASEFPVPPSVAGAKIDIPASEMTEIINKTIFSVGDTSDKAVLGNILFKASTQGLFEVAATNGHWLAAFEMKKEGIKKDQSALVPKKALAELKKFLSDSDSVGVVIGKSQVKFTIGNVNLLVRLSEGPFPNYEQVIPKNNENIVIIGRESLIKSLKKAKLMLGDSGRYVTLDLTPEQIEFSSKNTETGDFKEQIEADFIGQPMTVSFNPDYLLDALGAMNTEQVFIRFNTNTSPVLVTEDGKDDYKYVVMPIKP